MAGETSFKSPAEMLEGAREARIQMLVFRHNIREPGEVAGLSRLMWQTIPELARMSGVDIRDDEGFPPGISSKREALTQMVARDMAAGRDVAEWLGAVTSPTTKAMFARGADNAMDGVFEQVAREDGFVRRDQLAQERGAMSTPDRAPVMSPVIAAHLAAQRSR